MKRLLLTLILWLPAGYALADVTDQPPPSSMAPPSSPGGGDTFGSQVQQSTTQAQAIFQGVDYKTLSGNQDQNYFFSSDDSSDTTNLSTLVQKFKLAPGN